MGKVTVKSKLGTLGTVDDSDLQNALKHGFSVPDDSEIQEHNDRIEHGSGIINPALALTEEAASTATFGASRELENISGLTTPEAQAARAKYNPVAHLAGIPTGLVADPLGAVGLVGKLGSKTAQSAAKIIGEAAPEAGFLARAGRSVPAAAMGAAAEGAAYGIGQSVAEHALGDPDLNAEKIMSNLGYGALMAGSLGGVLEGGANAFGKSLHLPTGLKDEAKAQSYQQDIQQAVADREKVEGTIAAMGVNPDIGQIPPFKDMPKSLEDISQMVRTNFPIAPEGLPSYSALKEIDSRLGDEIQFKTHNLQMESLKDQGLRDYYKTFLESQGEDAKALRGYEALQKAEGVAKVDSTIKELAPDAELAQGQVAGGESAIKAFTDQYKSEKEALTPLFKKFDELAGNKTINPMNSLLRAQEEIPNIGLYVDADANGVFKLKPYSSSMSLTKKTYAAVKDLVKAANEKGLTLSDLRNVRESMRDRLNLLATPRDQAQIGTIRKALMDEMESHISELALDQSVRDTFRRYAQNEEKRSIIEKILGGSISDKASFAKTIKPEDVLSKIFSNSVSVNAAKDILGKDFSKVLADYLNEARQKVTDETRVGFSSNKFSTFLRSKHPELSEALSENPAILQKLNDLTDRMKILPDSPSVNPSGTAKTMNILEKMAGLSRMLKPTHVIGELASSLAEKSADSQRRFTIGEVLGGKTLQGAKDSAEDHFINTSSLARLGRYADQAATAIAENAKAVFSTATGLAKKSVGIIGSKLAPSPMHKVPKNNDDSANNGKHHDVFARINELQNNPEQMLNTLQNAVSSIYPHAPGIAQGMQAAAVRATQLLSSKLPPQMPQSAFSLNKYEPSASELADFERTYNVIEDPMQAMVSLKNGSITPDEVTALSTVYPKMHQAMQVALINEASKVMARKEIISTSTKQALSIFMGAPVDESFSPQAIMANQASFQMAMQQHQQEQANNMAAGAASKLTIAQRTAMPKGTNVPA